MSIVSLLLNLLWIVFGGLWMALAWVIAAVVMAITIVGLPWARAAFSIAAYTLLPFGYKTVPRDEYFGREDVGSSPWLVWRAFYDVKGAFTFRRLAFLKIRSVRPHGFRRKQTCVYRKPDPY
jgi:hypothetical protein